MLNYVKCVKSGKKINLLFHCLFAIIYKMAKRQEKSVFKAIPAYGRHVNTTYEKVVKEWKEGKDFKFVNGPYFSIRDFDSIKNENYHKAIDNMLFGAKEDAPVLCIFFRESNSERYRIVEIYSDGDIAYTAT